MLPRPWFIALHPSNAYIKLHPSIKLAAACFKPQVQTELTVGMQGAAGARGSKAGCFRVCCPEVQLRGLCHLLCYL